MRDRESGQPAHSATRLSSIPLINSRMVTPAHRGTPPIFLPTVTGSPAGRPPFPSVTGSPAGRPPAPHRDRLTRWPPTVTGSPAGRPPSHPREPAPAFLSGPKLWMTTVVDRSRM
ncbi:hypothetical protein Axi01nite_84740 [Actinoplanes xinjiangensis]|nr:hypothetical protein Axi01nite_84740 [Actinoplanes xinjiangensis]